jgi:hypothetical protein
MGPRTVIAFPVDGPGRLWVWTYHPGVHAYQVTQEEDAIDIALVAPSRDESDVGPAITAAVARQLEPLDVAHTPVRVRVVNQITRPDIASGKFKLVQARPPIARDRC